jgi:hypothetical protein
MPILPDASGKSGHAGAKFGSEYKGRFELSWDGSMLVNWPE